LQIGISGCQQAANEKSESETSSTKIGDDNETVDLDETDLREKTTPQGWTLYSPPEKDFSVMVPEGSVEVSGEEVKVAKVRHYKFNAFNVDIYTDRKGSLAGNSVEELKADTTDYVPGSLRDISLGDMPGIEFRTNRGAGETVFREFCASDNSLSISLWVYKETGEGLLEEEEVRLFLDSFKLLPVDPSVSSE
jgi:hypothetical protein